MAKYATENFEQALQQLKEYLSQPVLTNRDRAGIIQGFEMTYEQAWKTIQKFSIMMGSDVGNPRQAFTLAIQSQWIPRAEESVWLSMIEDRNLTSHTYHQDLANEVLARIREIYLAAFDRLLSQLKQIN